MVTSHSDSGLDVFPAPTHKTASAVTGRPRPGDPPGPQWAHGPLGKVEQGESAREA